MKSHSTARHNALAIPDCTRVWQITASVVFLVVMLMTVPIVSAQTSDYVAAINELRGANFNRKSDIVKQLVASGESGALPVLKALLAGNLSSNQSGQIVIVTEASGGHTLIDALTGQPITAADDSGLKKITINNKLRGELRNAIAQLSIFNVDPDVRLTSLNDIMKDINGEIEPLLQQALQQEQDERVIDALNSALALLKLEQPDKQVRIEAIRQLEGRMMPEIYNRLARITATDEQGNPVEKDDEVRAAAVKALATIDSRRDFYSFIETTFFGLSLGSVLVLAAIGLAITFGVMGVINMAHGELIMLGAYTTYVVQLLMPQQIGASLFVAIPLAFIVSGATGMAIQYSIIRHLSGRPLETLLATFGISLVLQQLVRTIFSPLNRTVSSPEWMSGTIQINSALAITANRLYIMLFCLVVFAVLLMILKKTVLGLQVRAVALNRPMAMSMGIRTGWVDALTFGLGSGIAGIAGVALSQLTNVGPNLGQAYIIDSFMVVVFGGVGNLWGTLIAGMSLGVVNKFLEPYAGAVLAKILILVFIILFIQKRPRGLFPQKGRAVEQH